MSENNTIIRAKLQLYILEIALRNVTATSLSATPFLKSTVRSAVPRECKQRARRKLYNNPGITGNLFCPFAKFYYLQKKSQFSYVRRANEIVNILRTVEKKKQEKNITFARQCEYKCIYLCMCVPFSMHFVTATAAVGVVVCLCAPPRSH